MSQYPLSSHLVGMSPLVYGCMGLGGGWNTNVITAEDIKQTHEVIDTALLHSINYFDHADIYTFGKAEQVFGRVLAQRPELREQMFIQTKCGIRFEDDLGPKRYDLSAKWINHSVEKSLAELHIDYLDVLVLHRPDPLMQPHEIAETFHRLRDAGKVKYLGVSNMQQFQISGIQQYLDMPLVLNQIEVNLQQQNWLDEGIYAGNQAGGNINFTAGLVEYCKQNSIQIQSWGSLCQGLFTGADVSDKPLHIQQTSQLVTQLAQDYACSREAIVLAWLIQHPAQIQPVIGTTNLQRIQACAQVSEVSLTREQWYSLFVSAKGQELP